MSLSSIPQSPLFKYPAEMKNWRCWDVLTLMNTLLRILQIMKNEVETSIDRQNMSDSWLNWNTELKFKNFISKLPKYIVAGHDSVCSYVLRCTLKLKIFPYATFRTSMRFSNHEQNCKPPKKETFDEFNGLVDTGRLLMD